MSAAEGRGRLQKTPTKVEEVEEQLEVVLRQERRRRHRSVARSLMSQVDEEVEEAPVEEWSATWLPGRRKWRRCEPRGCWSRRTPTRPEDVQDTHTLV